MMNGAVESIDHDGLLEPLRARLDEIDDKVLDLLVERMSVCLEVADVKAVHGIPMMQPGRVGLVIQRAADRARVSGLDPQYLSSVYRLVIDATCAAEDDRMIDQREGRA